MSGCDGRAKRRDTRAAAWRIADETGRHRAAVVRVSAGMRRGLRACAAMVLAGALLGNMPTRGETLTFPSTADEVKQGAQLAHQIESHYRMVSDAPQLARITGVGDAVAAAVQRRDLTFHFQIVGTSDVASVSLPGGWVYVTEGMMRFVRTDDELAAVLGHELAEIDHHDYYIQEARMRQIGALIAQLFGQNTGYQQDLEEDADLTSVTYLQKTTYSPVAMLTVLEHLVQTARLTGQFSATGTSSQAQNPLEERAEYLKTQLNQRHIPIIRRAAEGYLKITLDPPAAAGGEPVTIRVDGTPVLTLATMAEGQTPAQRAQNIVARLDTFFNGDPTPYDVHVTTLLGQTTVIGGQTVLYNLSPEDAAYAHVDPRILADRVRFQLARAIAAAAYNQRF
jgi:beta-barrel assembly-enhancing protease